MEQSIGEVSQSLHDYESLCYLSGSPPGLGELARLLVSDRLAFFRMLRGYFSMSADDYLEGCQVERAAALLIRSGLSLAEIGKSCEFPSVRAFVRSFTRLKGVSPADYRDRKRPWIHGAHRAAA